MGVRPSSPALTGPAASLLGLHLTPSRPRINLTLLDFDPTAVFAGVKTAVEAGMLLGDLSGRDVRLVLLNPTRRVGPEREHYIAAGRAWLADHLPGATWEIVCDDDLRTTRFGTEDIWVATHWMTAHALDRAAHAGLIERRQVLYLIQDYEPDFFAADEDRVAAESTYAAGFTPVVNTRQVASYLESRGFGAVAPAQVFAPQFDTAQLMKTAMLRRRSGRPTVFFYGRPSKPRNMFDLGVAALRVAADELARKGIEADFIMAGERGRNVDLGNGSTLRNAGVLTRPDYFSLISRVDVGLTLQATPHPSHLPFDLAISGVPAVTNEVDGSRNRMHTRIIAVNGTPEMLGTALVTALVSSRQASGARSAYLPVRQGQMGVPIRDALSAALSAVDRRAATATPSP